MADEQALIDAAKADPSRFGDLYDENFERVYAFVARRVRDRRDVEDITATVFQQALANLQRFEWRGAPFAAWLYRIASNAVIDHLKSANREVSLDADAVANDAIEDVERRAMLFRSVGRLPADQRKVIFMRFAEGKSIREIAGELGKSEGAVKQLQFRGLQALRTQVSHG